MSNETTPPGTQRTWGSVARLGVQFLGFVIGLGLIWWVVSEVLKPENRDKLNKLASASWEQTGGLLGLSALVVMISGGVFRQALTPVRRLGHADVQATNAIASLLALLPFKLSVLFRVLVHNRRDGVPLLTIGAWFVAVVGSMGVVIVPVLAMSALWGKADALWAICTLALVALCTGAMILVARMLASPQGWKWVQGVLVTFPVPANIRTSPLMDRVHEGLTMLSSTHAVLSCVGLRLFDIGVQAARVKLAASITGQVIGWDHAVLAGGMYFLIGALAPTGQIGAREAGTAAIIGKYIPGADVGAFAVVVLAISAAETVILLAGSMLGLIYLRPDRLLGLKSSRKIEAEEPDADS